MKEIHFDGFVRGRNPGKKGGWTIFVNGDCQLETFNFEKDKLTNNEVELRGALEASKWAEEGDILVTDSMNTICWVKRAGGGKQLKARPDLTSVAKEVFDIIKEKKLELEWKPRDKNLAGIYNETNFNA